MPGKERDDLESMWQLPGFKSLTAAYVFARLPVGLVALAIALAALQLTDSLAVAGWAETCYVVGMAAGLPAMGRLVDKLGTRTVILATGAAQVATLGLLGAVSFGWIPGPVAVFLLLSALAGATVPPAGPVIRTAWNDMVAVADLPKVNALESTLAHSFYVVGAGAVAAATWVGQLGYAFALCGVLNALGVVLLLRGTATVTLPTRRDPAPLTAVFRQPGAGRVLAAVAGWALVLSGFEYAIIGWAAAADRETLAGVVIGITAFAAVVVGLVLGGRHAQALARVRTSTWMATWAVALIPLMLAAQHHAALLVFVVAAIVARIPSVGAFTALIAHTTHVATPGLRTETFAWRMTVHLVAGGIGTAVCGTLAEHYGTGVPAAFGIASAFGVALLLAGRRGRDLHELAPPPARPGVYPTTHRKGVAR